MTSSAPTSIHSEDPESRLQLARGLKQPPALLPARHGLLPRLQGPGHSCNTGIYGTQEYSAHGSLHGAVAGQIQELLEGLIPPALLVATWFVGERNQPLRHTS
jgi:hypothetical protein